MHQVAWTGCWLGPELHDLDTISPPPAQYLVSRIGKGGASRNCLQAASTLWSKVWLRRSMSDNQAHDELFWSAPHSQGLKRAHISLRDALYSCWCRESISTSSRFSLAQDAMDGLRILEAHPCDRTGPVVTHMLGICCAVVRCLSCGGLGISLAT